MSFCGVSCLMRSMRPKKISRASPEPAPAKQPEAEPETQQPEPTDKAAPGSATHAPPAKEGSGSPTHAPPAEAVLSSPMHAPLAEAVSGSPTRAPPAETVSSSPMRATATASTEAAAGMQVVECVASVHHDASNDKGKVSASASVRVEAGPAQEDVADTQVDEAGAGVGGALAEARIQEDLDKVVLAQMVQEVLRRPATCDLEAAIHAALSGKPPNMQQAVPVNQPQGNQLQQVPTGSGCKSASAGSGSYAKQ